MQDVLISENTVRREKSHASEKVGNFFSTLLEELEALYPGPDATDDGYTSDSPEA